MQDKGIDPNLEPEKLGDLENIEFRDVREKPFRVYGVYFEERDGIFRRLPEEVAAQVSNKVHELSERCAGGRVRFSTDADCVVLRAAFKYIFRRYAFALSGSAGFDLFVDEPESGVSHFYSLFKFEPDVVDGYTSKISFPSRKLRYITINFPTYSTLSSLEIGLPKDAKLGEGLSYKPVDPIVYYGSSITQGCACSRPGNTYESIVCRKTNIDYLNFGFSGSAKGEPAIRDYLATLPMSAFVSDFDHNIKKADLLREVHAPLYLAIREKHPDIPYIMLTRPDVDSMNYENVCRNRDVVMDTYRLAREQGDRNVYFIDGEGIFRGPYEDLCTVDNTHPNELGFALMADAVWSALCRSSIRPLLD